ncbi:MAG TPA: cytochrome c [Anaeromyxobacter sp.]
MTRAKTAAARLAALSLLALAACPRLDPMQRQQKYKAYQESEYFDDGIAMRLPPAGTVPFRSTVDPALGTGLGPDGKPLALSPLPVTAATIARGRARFEVYCAVCHGVLGDGVSQVALNMSLRKPANLHGYREVPDGYIFRVITHGFGLMPSYAAQLPPEDRWAVVAYVRALQLSQYASLEQLPADARARLEKEGR